MALDMESFLKNFHKKNPGCTSVTWLHGKAADGRTSYECVSETLLKNTGPAAVLDLACGDGILLEILHNQNIPGLMLSGIDMSEEELEAAKKRLAGLPISIFEGRAQALPFENEKFDFIFCHLALMLMNEADTVLAEIYRTLKPQGYFSAIIGGGFMRSPIMETFANILHQVMREEGAPRLTGVGDTRIRSAELVKPFFETLFAEVEVKELELSFRAKPVDLRDFFMLTYEVDMLSESGKEILEERVLNVLGAMTDSDGTIGFPFGLRQITCRK